MLKDIIAVNPLQGYKLHLRFEDNQEGIVDIQQQIKFTGVFAPLKDPNYFAQVKVNPELGTIQWPNGADLDPDVLYEVITKSQSGALLPTTMISTKKSKFSLLPQYSPDPMV